MKIFDKNVRSQLRDPQSIPIIIINFNRLEVLKNLLNFLLKRGHSNIIIIDNNSNFKPLLQYYNEIAEKVKITHLKQNVGHDALWKLKDLYSKYCTGYYVVTDSDIIPNENLPINYLGEMIKYLNKHSEINKVGFALRIDDIPDTYKLKELVINWEKKFWENEVEKNVFRSSIDTTFAVYFPKYHPDQGNFYSALRLGGNYCARHSDWYIDHDNLSDEQKNYLKTANNSNSWKTDLGGNFIKIENNLAYL